MKNHGEAQKESRTGDSGNSWIQKAFQRAKEQAKDEGRDLEEVVAERWGVSFFYLLPAQETFTEPMNIQLFVAATILYL